MRSYNVARKIFSILEFAGWAVVIIGVLLAIVFAGMGSAVERSFGDGGGVASAFMGLVSGLLVSVVGLFVVGAVQNWRAGVDTAEYTQQMLKIARDQLEVSRQSLRTGGAAPTTFAGLAEDPQSGQAGVSFNDVVASDGNATSNADAPLPVGVQKRIEYRGRTILKQDDRYIVEGKSFLNLSNAQKRIDVLVQGKV